MIPFTSANARMWSRLGPGGAMGVAAMELPDVNDKTIFLSADMSSVSGLDRFKSAYPDRFINVGIAEQNLVGVAAGLASEGYAPFAVTYATFFAMRAADQIKVNMGYMKLGVKLIGNFAGFSTGILGPTHMSIEDVAVMRSIPNMTIISPADCGETVKAMLAASEMDSPVYIRLTGSIGMPIVYKEDYSFIIGKAIQLRQGTDITIIASGSMVFPAIKAAELLDADGISSCVINMHTIKPLDTEMIDRVSDTSLIVSIEEHNIIGGLGGALAEYLSGLSTGKQLFRIGVDDYYPHAGEYSYLLDKCGLTAQKIKARIKNVLNGRALL
jgi:transketolase